MNPESEQKPLTAWLAEVQKRAEAATPGLLPCPFCGTKAVSAQVGEDDCCYHSVYCPRCCGNQGVPHCGVDGDDKEECEQIWNTRATTDILRLAQMLAVALEALERMEDSDGKGFPLCDNDGRDCAACMSATAALAAIAKLVPTI